MKIPVVTGTGERFDLDTDDYPRLVLLPEVCEGIDSRLWELFTEEPERASEQLPGGIV